jgi:hypothetical protein
MKEAAIKENKASNISFPQKLTKKYNLTTMQPTLSTTKPPQFPQAIHIFCFAPNCQSLHFIIFNALIIKNNCAVFSEPYE